MVPSLLLITRAIFTLFLRPPPPFPNCLILLSWSFCAEDEFQELRPFPDIINTTTPLIREWPTFPPAPPSLLDPWKDSLSPCSSLPSINSLCFIGFSLCSWGILPENCWVPSQVLALGICSSHSWMGSCAACPTVESHFATHQLSGYSADTALGAAQTHESDPSPEGLQLIQRKQWKILEILGCKAQIHRAYSKLGFTVGLQTTL